MLYRGIGRARGIMKVIKRDGSTVEFDRSKIENAIRKANAAVDENERIEDCEIVSIPGLWCARRTRQMNPFSA